MSEMTAKPSIYHEKQVKELCALHALNNLFQMRGTYSKTELDAICSRLSPNVWINPHRSMLGLGNYDINVIMAALQKMGCEALWFDKRKEPACLNLAHICGFILNVPSDYKLGFVMLPLRRRHWITIRQIQGSFYNLDSKLEAPQLIGRSNELLAYLKEQLDSKEKELFVIVSKEVEERQLWMHQNTTSTQNTHPGQNSTPDAERHDQNHYTSQNSYINNQYENSSATLTNHIDSPTDSISSYPTYDYSNRDAECLKLTEVRNCVVTGERDNF